MPGGRVFLVGVFGDGCSDHRVLSACSPKARQVQASDTRLFLRSGGGWSTMTCVDWSRWLGGARRFLVA